MGTVSMDTPFKEAAVPNFLPYEIPPSLAISLLFIRHHQTCPLAQGWPGKADHTPFPQDHPTRPRPLKGTVPPSFSDKDKSIYTPWNFKIRFLAVLFYSIFLMVCYRMTFSPEGLGWCFALYCGLFHHFSCLAEKYPKAWRPVPRPENKTKIKTHYTSKMVAAFNLLINQSRDWCITVEGARKGMFDWRICEGNVMLKGAAPALSTGPGAWQREFQRCAWRERARPKLETWTSFYSLTLPK